MLHNPARQTQRGVDMLAVRSKDAGRIDRKKKEKRKHRHGNKPVLRDSNEEHLLKCAQEILEAQKRGFGKIGPADTVALMRRDGEGADTDVASPLVPRSENTGGFGKNRLTAEVRARYSAKYRQTPRSGSVVSANSPFLPESTTEECLKCLLRVPHKKCESHKYIRVGGGYRHGYWYIKCLLEELEMQRQREMLRLQRLDAITESNVRAIKTFIRTKSGRLVERIVFLNEEDYEAFKAGKNVHDILKKYLNKEEAAGLESWDKDEVKAIKTFVRTKSGRLIEKLVYVSKQDYDDIKAGRKDAKELLKKYVQEGEKVEGWDEVKMKTIKTYIRTKSGRLIEKVIMISQEDYDAMIKEGKDPADIIKKYLPLEEGETLESWKSAEPMRAIKTKIRTKSGRIIEKTIFVSAEDYDRMTKGGADAADILKKYMNAADGETLESWEKAPDGKPMKVVKTYVRTKSGRLIERTILLTEDEFRAFQESGGDPNFLKKFIKLEKGDVIEDWEKASTVYSAGDDPDVQDAEPGTRIVGKDGAVYEIVVDPVTGKKYKKKVGQQESDVDSGIASLTRGKGGKKLGVNGELLEEDEEEGGGGRGRRKKGKKGDGNDSSDSDTPGKGKKKKKERREHGEDSDHSYYSEVSVNGTHYRKRRKRIRDKDGKVIGHGKVENYSSPDGSDNESVYTTVSDGKGGKIRIKKKGGKGGKKGKSKHATGVFSDASTDSEDEPDLSKMTEEEKKIYFEEKAKRKDAREKRRREKYGDKYDEMMNKHTALKKAFRKPVFSDASTDSEDEPDLSKMTEEEKKTYFEEKAKRKAAREKRRREKYGDKYDDMVKENQKRKKDSKLRKPVFSDCSTDSEDEPDLSKMTEEEKKKYFEEKAKRKAARELRRREKYGDKYDDMMAEHDKRKKLLQAMKPVFSDCSTDSEDEPDLSKMTEEEKKKYFEEKAKRKAARELRRREKYGDKYDDMMAEHEKRKQYIKAHKPVFSDCSTDSEDEPDLSMMTDAERKKYFEDKAKRKADRELRRREKYGDKYDDMMAENEKRKKIRKGKDPNDADDESDGSLDENGKRKKKGFRKQIGKDGFEYTYDSKGRIISKKRLKKDGESSGSEYEYEYDEDGNVKAVTKVRKASIESDGDYFEVDEKGQIKLKVGKKKIDLSKLTNDDLRRLGIDPNLSKQEIARLLKERFGVEVVDQKVKVGTKRLSEYGSDVLTDDLADDSDLDISTLKGTRRVNVLMKRGGQTILDHIKKVMDQSQLAEDYPKDLDEKGDIDFLSHYRLVDPHKMESYARCFAVEDGDYDTVIDSKETRTALDGVPSIQQMTSRQMEYVLKVLQIDDASQITFRMFAVISALSERVTLMDPVAKHLIEICDLLDIQRKMSLYQSMFYCNVNSDRSSNFIKADSLRIELIAGGLNWKQQDYIMERLQPNFFNEISFLDYICYIPLFLSMHDNICNNPLDMSSNKFEGLLRKPSGGHRQRDINPLGQPLSKHSSYQLRQQAQDILNGKLNVEDVDAEQREVLNKYATLPKILQSPDSTPRSNSSLG